jgi:predicted nucleotidyltransferase
MVYDYTTPFKRGLIKDNVATNYQHFISFIKKKMEEIMNIEKYLKNKEAGITNDNIDFDSLTKDIRKGYVDEKEVDSRIKSAVDTQLKESTQKYVDLENKYNDLEKRNTDLTSKNQTLSLERTMIGQGFKEESFDEVSKLRQSLYADEKTIKWLFKKLLKDLKILIFLKANL